MVSRYIEENPYLVTPPEQQNQGGMQNLLGGLQMYQQFMPGAGGGAGAGMGGGMQGGPGLTGLLGQGGGAMSGMGGGGTTASGGGGSAVAAAGPWAALAAIILANETYAKKGGYRGEDNVEYGKDLLSGEVLHQDIEKRWLPNIGIDEGTKASKAISFLANPVGLDPGKSWQRLKGLFG